MLFRRIIFSALFVGLCGGLVMSVLQQFWVSPIIVAAEVYEIAEVGHSNAVEPWGPEDGFERTFYSVVANSLAGIGFAALLVALMSQFQALGITRLSPLKGLLWGTAGFVAWFAAPGIGLAPEIPGINAAALEQRQIWWLLTVLATAIGLGGLAFFKGAYRGIGVLLVAAPHVLGAPVINGAHFSHPDPDAVLALTQLHHDFIIATGVSNFLFWIVLGLVSAWSINQWVLKDAASH